MLEDQKKYYKPLRDEEAEELVSLHEEGGLCNGSSSSLSHTGSHHAVRSRGSKMLMALAITNVLLTVILCVTWISTIQSFAKCSRNDRPDPPYCEFDSVSNKPSSRQ